MEIIINIFPTFKHIKAADINFSMEITSVGINSRFQLSKLKPIKLKHSSLIDFYVIVLKYVVRYRNFEHFYVGFCIIVDTTLCTKFAIFYNEFCYQHWLFLISKACANNALLSQKKFHSKKLRFLYQSQNHHPPSVQQCNQWKTNISIYLVTFLMNWTDIASSIHLCNHHFEFLSLM